MAVQSIPDHILEKQAALEEHLRAYESIAVAYSGGVDSAYLSDVAHAVLGPERAQIILADSPSLPRSEYAEAVALAEERGWNLRVIRTNEFENEAYLANDGTRCYFCRSELFDQMDAYARENGVQVLAYGEIADDALDPTRLGAKAARQYKVAAPLAELGLHKEEIRRLSRERGLRTWNKASFACLSSRFPKGTRVDVEELRKVEAAEEVLRELSFRQYRVRHHGELCRIEVEAEEAPRLLEPDMRRHVLEALTQIGYKHITVDLAGYRTGSTAGGPSATM